jgi:hypothetical protein
VLLTYADRRVLADASDAAPCWFWELGAETATYLDDRTLKWNGLDPGAAQAAALDLPREGLAVVWAEPLDEKRRYTGETFVADDEEALAAVTDSANWREPGNAPSRRTVYSLGATARGRDAAERAGWPEPDEVTFRDSLS